MDQSVVQKCLDEVKLLSNASHKNSFGVSSND